MPLIHYFKLPSQFIKIKGTKIKKRPKTQQKSTSNIFYGDAQNTEDRSHFDVTPDLTICLDKSHSRQQHILRPGGACTPSIRLDEPTQSLSSLLSRNFGLNPQLYHIHSFSITSSHWSYFYMILLVSFCQMPSCTHRYLINASA